MAKESRSSIGVTVTGDGVETEYVPATDPLVNAAAPGAGPTPLVLAAGNQTVALPAGAKGVVISPPAGSTNTKVLKGVNGDTGISMQSDGAVRLTFLAGTVDFVINSVGIETVDLFWL